MLGIDPGLADTGYGAVRRLNGRLTLVTCGSLKTPANMAEPQRLRLLAEQMRSLLADLHPEAAAFEELFFSKNVRTAMAVGQARGVALLSAVEAGAIIHEYTPNQVKLSVTGYGAATKGQICGCDATSAGCTAGVTSTKPQSCLCWLPNNSAATAAATPFIWDCDSTP